MNLSRSPNRPDRVKTGAFLTVAFLNAFTDVGHKIIIHNIIYKCFDGAQQLGLASLVNALILLPFVLFFSPTGFLSDKFSKQGIIRFAALGAIPLTGLITLCYALGLFWISFALTFLLAAQSALYGPAKYGYIQEILEAQFLSRGIGALQSVTIAAILFSSVLYSYGFEFLTAETATHVYLLTKAAWPLGILLALTSLVEWLLARRIPPSGISNLKLQFHFPTYIQGGYLITYLQGIMANPYLLFPVIGLSFFWAVNQVILASFPVYFKESTGIENVFYAQGIAALAGVGIIAGSLLTGKWGDSALNFRGVLAGGLGMAACLILLPSISSPSALAALILIYGFFGGVFVVVLNSLLQRHTSIAVLGRTLAGKNFFQNFSMLFFLGGSMGCAYYSIPVIHLFYALAGIFGACLVIMAFGRKNFRLPSG